MDPERSDSNPTSGGTQSVSIKLGQNQPQFSVAVLGRGLYGRALASRMSRCGDYFDVRVGSRDPDSGQHKLCEAVQGATIVFLAVPANAHQSVINVISPHLCDGAVLVDVSNHPLHARPRTGDKSIAEYLRDIAPRTVIVAKAFNTISSYDIELQGVTRTSPVVHIACDSPEAANHLSDACVKMGLAPVLYGGLDCANELELQPHRLFPTWKLATATSVVVSIWWILYTTLWGYVFNLRSGGKFAYDFNIYPLLLPLIPLGEICMTLFSITFLAGSIAGIIQLIRRNSTKPFGRFMGGWLGMRKELGVIAFVLSVIHSIVGAMTAHDIFEGDWKHGTFYLSGVLSVVLFGCLATSSMGTIANNMSWAEFRAVFSWMGIAAYVAGAYHQIL